MYADGKLSGSVNQRDYSPQQTWNEEVGDEDREPAACAHLRVEEMRQGKYHGWHDRQKDAVCPNNARALDDVSAKEKLLGSGLNRGENQCQRDEEHKRREVGGKGEGVGVEEVLSQHTDQADWHEPRYKPLSDTPPVDLLLRRDQRPEGAAVDEGDGEENPRQEERKTRHDVQEASYGTERGVIRLTAERERDEDAGDRPDDQPREENDHQPQNIPPPPILTPPGSLHISHVFPFRADSRLSFSCFDPHLCLLDLCVDVVLGSIASYLGER